MVKIIRKHLPILLLIVFWFIYHFKIIFFNNLFYLGDAQAYCIAYRKFFIDSLKNGIIPLWDSYSLSGTPFLLIASLGLLNPSTLLFFLTTPERAMTLAIILNNLFSGILTYYFALLITKNKISSFFSGLIYMFSGFMANATNSDLVTQQLPLIPLSFIFIEYFLRTGKLKFLLYLSLTFTLMFVSGIPMILYLTILFISLYYFLNSDEKIILKLKNLLLIAVFSFLLSAFLLIPQLELSAFSSRPKNDFNYSTNSSFHPLSIVNMVFPHFLGISEIELPYSAKNRNYIGIIPLILIITEILYRVKIKKRLYLLCFLGFIFSFGKYNPLYKILLYLPGLSFFREPQLFIIFYIFFSSIISGIILADLKDNRKKYSNFFKLFFNTNILIIIIFLVLSNLYLYLKKLPSITFQNMVSAIYPLLPINKSIQSLLLISVKLHTFLLINISNMIFSILILILFLLTVRYLKSRWIFTGTVVLITFFDLIISNSSELYITSNNDYQNIYSASPVLINLIDKSYRIHSVRIKNPINWDIFNRENYIKSDIKNYSEILYPAKNLYYQIYSVDGFYPLISKDYVNYISDKKDNLTGISSFDINLKNKNLGELAVKYLISNQEIPEVYSFKLKYNTNDFYLYENSVALNRVFMIDNKGQNSGDVKIVEEKPNSVKITTSSNIDSSLVLLDTFHPGWKAYIDNKETPIKKYENVFRQIDLTAGNHVVEFKFLPRSLIIGSLISLAFIAIILLKIFLRFDI